MKRGKNAYATRHQTRKRAKNTKAPAKKRAGKLSHSCGNCKC